MPESSPSVLYTPAQRARRDATRWTLVQGVLAPVQFLIFGISLFLVVRSLQTGTLTDWALGSVVLKTLVLYAIMITGAIWEKVVFGQYLFAPAFYWEDVVSMGVLALAHRLFVGLVARALERHRPIAVGVGCLRQLCLSMPRNTCASCCMARLQKPTSISPPPGAQVQS